ncbi:MAG: ribulokinase [Actinobacteria bacterium]|nr:MAG: ribulokinase [Actinomycetota bacterium]
MTNTYTIGLDFGTLSGRAVVVRASDGEELGAAVHDYQHGVMDRTLNAGDNRPLPPDYALQVPADYIEVLKQAVPQAVKESGVDPQRIIGIGVDFTSATVVVTDNEGTPLCEKPEFVNEPHAYVKLWKHHGATEQAERIVSTARERGETWLSRYGGVLSSELLLPKALELLEEAPAVYEKAAQIVDAVDWITWKMTGVLSYAAGDSGYKRMYQDGNYPSQEFLEALNPSFGTVYSDKMSAPVRPLGASVGGLTAEAAEWMGLPEGVSVASGNIDAHVTAPAVQAVEAGQLTAIMGTSTCFIVSDPDLHEVPGLFGVVEGGVVPSLWGYEAGQTAVGDIFAWFVDNCVPEEYFTAATQAGVTVHEYLTSLARQQEVGQHGLVALDWFNGNRSILADQKLSGLVLGQTLTTRPEDTYRALLESTAFGARVIIENYLECGVGINEIVVAGGLLKNDFLMQMYADITRLPLSTAVSTQAPAVGAAIFAAQAAGLYPDLATASHAMGKKKEKAYVPDETRAQRYDALYAQYVRLHDFFGKEAKNIMHELKDIQRNALT